MADVTISGQNSANPMQASTSGTTKTAQKASTPFDMLLALFQSGGLSGQILPGINGQLEIADDASLMTGTESAGKNSGQQASLDLVQNRLQNENINGKGTAPDLSSLSSAVSADLSTEAEKTGVVNLIAFLNSGGKSSADNVSANAIKPESPALIKALARQDGQAPSFAGNPEEGSAAVKENGNDLITGIAKQELKNAKADLPGTVPAGHKTGDSSPLPADGAKPEKAGRDNPADRSKMSATMVADTETSSGPKGRSPEIFQETFIKSPENAAAAAVDNFRFKESPGEKTAAAGSKSEAVKAPQAESPGISVRAEHAGSGAADRLNNSPELLNVKGTESKIDRELAPRTEPVKTPGHTVSGGIHAQGASTGFRVAAAPGADISLGESLTGAILEQVSEGSIELFRTGGGRVKLSLSPPELGSVDMDLIVDRTGMRLVLTSESADVRSVLQANMDQLRSSLQDQGLNRFEVLVQDRPNSDSGGWQAGSNSGRDSLHNGGGGANGRFREDGTSAFSRPATDNRPAANPAGRENSNGELSLFA